MCYVWISEQTAFISLYSIYWLVLITETESLLRGTDWNFIYVSRYTQSLKCLIKLGMMQFLLVNFLWFEVNFTKSPTLADLYVYVLRGNFNTFY